MIPLRDVNPTERRPYVTIALIIVNIAVFLLFQQGSGFEAVDTEVGEIQVQSDLRLNLEYAAVPCELAQGRPLTLSEVSATFQRGNETACSDSASGPALFGDKNIWLAVLFSMFLHAGWFHLGGNMLYLWIFGNNIEDHLGRFRFLLFYLVGGAVATAAHVLPQMDSTVPVIGASGAIAAVMGAYLVWFPDARVYSLVFVLFLPIKAKFLLAVWFLMQFFTESNSGVAWLAHVGGFVFGVVIGAIVRASRKAQHAAFERRYWQEERWDSTGQFGHGRFSDRPEDRRFGGRNY